MCVQIKGARPPRNFTARPAESVFCLPRLYSLPRFTSDMQRGLAAWLVHLYKLADLGADPATLADIVGRFCDAFEGVSEQLFEKFLAKELDLPLIRLARHVQARNPDRKGHLLLLNAIISHFLRNPAWMDSVECRKMLVASIAHNRATWSNQLAAAMGIDGIRFGDEFDIVLDRMMPLLLLTLLRRRPLVRWSDFNSLLEVVRAPEGIGFVIGDNPCRPFVLGHWRSFAGPRPPLESSATRTCFPLGPDFSLMLRLWPKHGRLSRPRLQRRTATMEEVRMMNAAQVVFASKEVVFPAADRAQHLPADLDPDGVPRWVEPMPAASALSPSPNVP